ncbi:glycosylphosphatidylinositol anchor attachment 1 protein [Leptidea sinapis]|uniref:glycosylphosphatidylinositol anchor attachment 1 protein n=1 Tax=Leptidea sinapis TaxID=189913 RepID=UPI0021C4B1CD|nr:glycosylphosphatidylinositol anchor attachment 1 protein [Leptidea sinapis]
MDTQEIPVDWLVSQMSQLHLEVYTHNFTLNYPLGQGQIFKGTNVYGILRAPRTSSLEALVLAAPFRSLSSFQKGTEAGIALMLAFAEFARPKKYWAKDIIFLVTEHEQLGMQAWLEAYHGLQSDSGTFYTNLGSFQKPPLINFKKFTKSKLKDFNWFDRSRCLDPGTLKGRSGAIQAAINLEFHTPKIRYVEVKVEGLNGQLPNLDLVNLVHKLCVKSGIHHSYKNSYSWLRKGRGTSTWRDGVSTMLGMVTAQIAGVPNGNHGLFHRFGIEAVTLEGRDVDDISGAAPRASTLPPANFHRLGTALESIYRSLNNLLESFHQSYFFYMLAATDRFVSIGQYMPSLCLLCGAMLLRALSLWVSVQKDPNDDKIKKDSEDNKDSLSSEQKNEEEIENELNESKIDDSERLVKDTEGKVESKGKVPDEIQEDKEIKKREVDVKPNDTDTKSGSDDIDLSIVNIGANFLIVHLIGYGAMNSPFFFSYIGAKYLEVHPETSVYYGLTVTSALVAVLSPFLLRVFRTVPISNDELSVISILLLLEMATACLCIGMNNFSLGFALAVVYTPLMLVVGVNGENRLVIFVKRALCVLVHPLVALTVALSLYSRVLYPEEDILGMAKRGREATIQAVMFAVADSMIYGNWLFNVATSVIFPTWIVSWQILCTTVRK